MSSNLLKVIVIKWQNNIELRFVLPFCNFLTFLKDCDYCLFKICSIPSICDYIKKLPNDVFTNIHKYYAFHMNNELMHKKILYKLEDIMEISDIGTKASSYIIHKSNFLCLLYYNSIVPGNGCVSLYISNFSSESEDWRWH